MHASFQWTSQNTEDQKRLLKATLCQENRLPRRNGHLPRKYNLPRLNSDDLEKMTGLMPRTENDVVRKKLPAGIPVVATLE